MTEQDGPEPGKGVVSEGESDLTADVDSAESGSPGLLGRAVQVVIFLSIVAGLVYLQTNDQTAEWVRALVERGGYGGIFAASILSGFNVAVPVPIIALFPSFVAAGLSPVGTVLLIAAGMTCGDALGALLGRAGRSAVQPPKMRLVNWVDETRRRHPSLLWFGLVFYAAFVPLPNELIVMPLAYLGVSPPRIVLAVFFGNIVFNTLCAYGLLHIV